MPKKDKWFILDSNTELFISFYSVVLANCGWDVAFNAIDFGTEEAANNAITAWGLGEQTQYRPHRTPAV